MDNGHQVSRCNRPSRLRAFHNGSIAGPTFADNLPKMATGKIQRFKLREPALDA